MWTQVGERIRELRRERNLSRAQFGRIIGLSEQYVGKLERGAHSISGVAIARICIATGVSSDYILFGVADRASVAAAIDGLSREQIAIVLDIVKKVAQFIQTENGNNALIQEIMRRQQGKLI